ncbi:MAG: hypothetical protein ACE5Z5_05785 [Candidatus Bathyarchaeia archaeon]
MAEVKGVTLGKKMVELTATGPASDVPVGAGAAADVDLAVGAPPSTILEVLSLKDVSGLPDGVVLAGITYPDVGTVRLRVFNPTAGAITVTADSVTAHAVGLGY